MPACHAGDRRFDPGRDRHYLHERNILFRAFLCLTLYFIYTIISLGIYLLGSFFYTKDISFIKT